MTGPEDRAELAEQGYRPRKAGAGTLAAGLPEVADGRAGISARPRPVY